MTRAPAQLELARGVVEAEAAAVRSLAHQIDESLADAASLMLQTRGRVLVSGAGTSHAVALRLSHLLSCCGTPALFVHPSDALHGGVGAVTGDDVVVVISKGGESAEVNAFAALCSERGAKVIAITGRTDSSLARLAHLVLHVVAPTDIDPYGMVATGSSLVSAAYGDALCVVLLHARGYTREQFESTHPGGAVGLYIRSGNRAK